jgi:hypothetical protein
MRFTFSIKSFSQGGELNGRANTLIKCDPSDSHSLYTRSKLQDKDLSVCLYDEKFSCGIFVSGTCNSRSNGVGSSVFACAKTCDQSWSSNGLIEF